MLGLLPTTAGAAVLLAQVGTGVPPQTIDIVIPSGLPRGDIGPVVTQIITYALGVAGALAVLFLIVGGIYYITAQGDSERLEKAKKTIRNAIIGAVFILLSLVITITIQNALTTQKQGPPCTGASC